MSRSAAYPVFLWLLAGCSSATGIASLPDDEATKVPEAGLGDASDEGGGEADVSRDVTGAHADVGADGADAPGDGAPEVDARTADAGPNGCVRAPQADTVCATHILNLPFAYSACGDVPPACGSVTDGQTHETWICCPS